MARFIHGAGAWFEKHVEGRDAVREMDTRVGEAISALASLRDRVLAKRWGGAPERDEEAIENLRKAAKEALERVQTVTDSDFAH
jgi:hypothetical protein